MNHSLNTLVVWTVALCLTAILPTCQAAETSSRPPWKGQYKIRPTETDRLTEADVVGPDGIVYPNWIKTGIQGSIPRVEAAARIEEFGGLANDGKDDSAALDRACQAVGQKGGGAVLLGEGTYHLDWPVTVRHHGVVIRGLGSDKTKIIFRYALPSGGITFYGLKSGDRIGKNTQVMLHCRPTGLATMTIAVDDKVVHEWKAGQHSGNTFATGITGRAIIGRLLDGEHTLHGIAHYLLCRSPELPGVCSAQLPYYLERIRWIPSFKQWFQDLTRSGSAPTRQGERRG